jgi:hypothetical protein
MFCVVIIISEHFEGFSSKEIVENIPELGDFFEDTKGKNFIQITLNRKKIDEEEPKNS